MLHIVLDKSAIQSFSYDEGFCLHIYYYQCLTSILFLEILADLAKFEDKAKAQNEVGKISSKFFGMNTVVNDDALLLIKMNLLGYEVKVDDHRPFTSRGYEFKDDEGKTGFFLDEQPEEAALRNWEFGEFDDDHEELARRWRELTKGVDLAKMQKHLKNTEHIPAIQNYSELKTATITVADSPYMQAFFLQRLMDKVDMSKNERLAVNSFFRRSRLPIRVFAPYAYHCLCVDIAFCIALKNELVTTRPTNICDMSYMYYMPFCRIFATSDKVQFDFASAMYGGEKNIIKGQDLKADLKKIIEYKDAQKDKKYPQIPPGDIETITGDLWIKYFGSLESKSAPMKLTSEGERKLVDMLRKKMSYAEKAKEMTLKRNLKHQQ
jgi:hypothetical protein